MSGSSCSPARRWRWPSAPATRRHCWARLTSRSFARWGADDPEGRLAGANEILHLAEALGRADRALEARLYRIIVLLELGDVDAADREIALFCERAAELRQPFYRWYALVLPAMRALMDGRFDDAERLAGEALRLAEQAQDPAAVPVWGAQMLFLWWERGQVVELEAALDAIREVAGSMPAVEVTGTWIAAELGRLDEARERFERLAAAGFDYPRDTTFLTLTSSLAATCGLLDDATHAEVLYEQLLPYAGTNIMVWATAPGGPVDHFLGVLTTTLGRYDAAEAHFDAALELCARLRSPRYEARAQHGLAVMLTRRGAPGDAERAAALCEQARATRGTSGWSRCSPGSTGSAQPFFGTYTPMPSGNARPVAHRLRRLRLVVDEPDALDRALGTGTDAVG